MCQNWEDDDLLYSQDSWLEIAKSNDDAVIVLPSNTCYSLKFMKMACTPQEMGLSNTNNCVKETLNQRTFSRQTIFWIKQIITSHNAFYSDNYFVHDKKKTVQYRDCTPTYYYDKERNKFTKDINSLITELELSSVINSREQCALLFQITTFVGEDIFDDYQDRLDGACTRDLAREFLDENSGVIDF